MSNTTKRTILRCDSPYLKHSDTRYFIVAFGGSTVRLRCPVCLRSGNYSFGFGCMQGNLRHLGMRMAWCPFNLSGNGRLS